MTTKDKISALMSTEDQLAHIRMIGNCSDNLDDVLWAAQAYVNRAIEVIRKEEEQDE